MNYTKIFTLILVAVLVMCCVTPPVLAVEGTEFLDYYGIDATTAYLGDDTITENVGAAFLYELNSDTMMYSYNADVKMYPSSLVKILTALLAIKEGNLSDKITVEQAVIDSVPYYAASAGLVAGEVISLSDLIYCMMVGSANDAASVIAVHISGSQSAFVQKMNSYAQTLGCTNTHFTNVHGLHDERQYTTARDIARILKEAASLDAFLKYFNTAKYSVPATNKTPNGRNLSTGNYLMNSDVLVDYYDSRVIGGRTGTTNDGLRCLATLAEVDSMRLICIVMGAESVYDDEGNTEVYGSFWETSALLDAGFTGHQVVQVLYENQTLKQLPVENGNNDVVVGAASAVYSVLPANISISDLSYRYMNETSIVAPITLGQVLSSVQVWYGGRCVGNVDLIAMNAVPINTQEQAPGQENTEKEENSNAILIIGSIVVGTILLVFIVFFAKRLTVILMRKRYNQYRRNRRKGRR